VSASTIGAALRRVGVLTCPRSTCSLGRGPAGQHSEIRFENDRPGSLWHADVKKLS
jgi:hypothetical protein